MFIPNKRAQTLLKEYAAKGISDSTYLEMLQLLLQHCPTMVGLLRLFHDSQHDLKCYKSPNEWSSFLCTLASPSPVCATVHYSDKLFHALKSFTDSPNPEDILKDMKTMQLLQKEIPVLFSLLQVVKTVPDPLVSIVKEMVYKSKAPFNNLSEEVGGTVSDEGDELSHFPQLPIIRSRAKYAADNVSKGKICTKRGTQHPTLLPGIFTIFCNHGNHLMQNIIF